MRTNLFKTALFGALVTSFTLGSCDKDKDIDRNTEDDGKRYITLTGAYPDNNGTAGNGGTRAYAITPEHAADPNYEVDLFKLEGGKYVNSFELKSQRTARVQGSEDGKYLYNIQYTGANGGVFNKYRVTGEKDSYEEVGFELNTAVILGTSPRWTKAAEGLGVGVSYSGLANYKGTAPDYEFQYPKGKITIANIDLNTTAITNTGSVDVNLGAELEEQGYAVWRADVPVLNQAKDKVFIGLGIYLYDIRPGTEATITTNQQGNTTVSWPRRAAADRELGTTTLVLDYPSLRNPKYISSTVAKTDNLSYRTMTQYLGTDGHVYQAATSMGSGHQILRISKTTNDYDNSYDFNLNTALGINDAGIRAFRYIKDGIGVVLYTRTGTPGGFVALVNLTEKTASKVNIENETEAGFSTTFGQFQNIGVVGDNIYVPMTPSGLDGNLYVINWRTKEVKKGAKLKNASGSFYLGAY